ncbi:MAG: hypothetical protein QXG00_05740 [Candidatus Woesearchaeota archaeon]
MNVIIKTHIKSIFLLLLISILTIPGFSQTGFVDFRSIHIIFGLSTSRILGDNPGAKPMVERDTSKPAVNGGSFDGFQPGFVLKLNFKIDKNGNFEIPLGFEYNSLRAAERVPISRYTTATLYHSVDVPAVSIGFNYLFFKFPLANVKAYIGLETRLNFIQSGTWRREIKYGYLDTTDILERKTKVPATRLGGIIHLGFEGEISEPLFINTSFGLGAMNLIGRDNSRGELLTFSRYNELEESIVYNYYFSLMLQYRF